MRVKPSRSIVEVLRRENIHFRYIMERAGVRLDQDGRIEQDLTLQVNICETIDSRFIVGGDISHIEKWPHVVFLHKACDLRKSFEEVDEFADLCFHRYEGLDAFRQNHFDLGLPREGGYISLSQTGLALARGHRARCYTHRRDLVPFEFTQPSGNLGYP